MISVLPNTITLGRLLSVPFLAIILSGHDYQLAFWFFLVLGFSDGLDGYVARRFNAVTTVGTILDPVADKLLVITCASILVWEGLLPLWIGIPLVLRDVVMLSVGLLDSKLRDIRVVPNLWGKSHAALAFLVIALAFAQEAKLFVSDLILSVMMPTLLVTLSISTVVYFAEWRRVRLSDRATSAASM
ncbi:MAG: CDP-alcohol phosphatidyltransferase family protein [Burkholderiales bacterium]|jgi:cardiolipin synthase|nr:CDP-alcohol phosphatidyltransferase family protein [Pseudomonadota bacterium]MDA1011790.1 CDP-alcohol phosphatidyltransferase family protein [Pseudomonadota bacterium]|tara:strand:- start:1860 stop:2420 length:561 start_codon:yes stop_codon:yes gene_type:complete